MSHNYLDAVDRAQEKNLTTHSTSLKVRFIMERENAFGMVNAEIRARPVPLFLNRE